MTQRNWRSGFIFLTEFFKDKKNYLIWCHSRAIYFACVILKSKLNKPQRINVDFDLSCRIDLLRLYTYSVYFQLFLSRFLFGFSSVYIFFITFPQWEDLVTLRRTTLVLRENMTSFWIFNFALTNKSCHLQCSPVARLASTAISTVFGWWALDFSHVSGTGRWENEGKSNAFEISLQKSNYFHFSASMRA